MPEPDPTSEIRATAYWTTGPGSGELRGERLTPPHTGEALVRSLHSGFSRGTELLVHNGLVPRSVAAQMRAPYQQGDFPCPVKYGYLSVGVVEQGPADLLGRTVFCLYPHQDRYVVPATALTLLPDGLPPRRAVLAGAMETAVNAVWDAGPRLGDRVAVVGGGMIGSAVATALRDYPLDRLQLIDINPSRAEFAASLGVDFASADQATGECDLVFHTSAASAGLARSLELAGDEAAVIELSWYGTGQVTVPLGADFHARRLTLRASQVSAISPSRRARRTHADRMRLAMNLLHEDALDLLLTESSPFAALPETVRRLASGELDAVCHVIDY
jgi:NADPH:quinone reductase-like Zn-dependent oxidoreductase